MASEKNETVADIVASLRNPDPMLRLHAFNPVVETFVSHTADRIETAHMRDREAARRRAERSAIYNMLESFPRDWDCNPGAVRKWMAAWYENADNLCEGGPYAEQ